MRVVALDKRNLAKERRKLQAGATASPAKAPRSLDDILNRRGRTQQQGPEPRAFGTCAHVANAANRGKWSSALRVKLRFRTDHDMAVEKSAQSYKRNRLRSRNELDQSARRHADAWEEFRRTRTVRTGRTVSFSLMPQEISPSPAPAPSKRRPQSAQHCSASPSMVSSAAFPVEENIVRLPRHDVAQGRPQTAPINRSSCTSSMTECTKVNVSDADPESSMAVSFTDLRESHATCGLNPANYFGRPARDAFFTLFKELCRQQATSSEAEGRAQWISSSDMRRTFNDDDSFEQLQANLFRIAETNAYDDQSPREKYARSLLQRLQLNRQQTPKRSIAAEDDFCLPEPLFVRLLQTDCLDLAHRGYGDGAALLLAKVINSLPNLQRLSMRDNRLTDRGISAIVAAVCGTNGARCGAAMTGTRRLVSLDLSQNVLDTDAVVSIANFLRRPDCQLVSLYLDSADIDDDEISLLVLSLTENSSLGELSISSNFLGGVAEKLIGSSVACRDRGSFNIERVLRVNHTLRKLNLSWNQLGSISGEAIARALHVNRSLAWLSLAYNCIGDSGAQAIGYALNWNKALQFLDISHNGIRNRGGQVIAEGLRDNMRLARIDVSGNPVGKLGGRALISILNYSLRPRKIIMRSCEFSGDDLEPGRFNPASPAGTYKLDLSRPHDWMIAQSLRWLTITRAGCRFTQLVESKGDVSREVKLKSPLQDQTAHGFKPPPKHVEQQHVLDATSEGTLRARVKGNLLSESFESLVAKYDRDSSGGLNQTELNDFIRKALKMMPTDVSEAETQRILKRLHLDQNGTVDARGMEACVLQEVEEAPARLSRESCCVQSLSSQQNDNLPSATSTHDDEQSKISRDEAKFAAACRLQAAFRGYIARIDNSQTKQLFSGGFHSSSVASALMDASCESLGFIGAATAKKSSKRMHQVLTALSRKKSLCRYNAVHSKPGKPRFRMFSRYAVSSSRAMRARMRASGLLDTQTNKPWTLPEPPASIAATFEEIPLPPIELSIQNATGVGGLLDLMMEDAADRLTILRLASTDLRLFSIQVIFVDWLEMRQCP